MLLPFSHEPKPRAFVAALLCAGGLLLAAPSAALASRPAVLAGGVSFVQATSKTTALTEALVLPEEQTTKYHVAWSTATSSWCSSKGVSGMPEHETTAVEITTSNPLAEENIELTGLEDRREYCVEGIATNASGTAHSEQPTFTSGYPGVVFDAASGVVATTTLASEDFVDPAGQATHYWVEYALASSQWCESAGKEGSPSHSSAHIALFAALEYTEVSLELTGLSSGTSYCAELFAENESGTAHSTTEAFATESILTVAIAGSGAGTVKTNTKRISCPGTCSASYEYDAIATLNAEPAAGSAFTGWSGGCSGTASKCNFKMNADTTVTATFTATPSIAPAPAPAPPTNPPMQKGKPLVNTGTGEIQVEYQFPEPGQAESYGEVTHGATLASVHAPPASATQSTSKRCPRGYVKKRKRCLNNAPVRFGQSTLTVATAGTDRLHVEPSGKVLSALRKGKTLVVRVTLIFTPAGTTDHIAEVVNATVHLKPKGRHH